MCLSFRYDTRSKTYEDARHWSDDETLGGRAFFRGDHDPGRLVLDNVRPTDQAVYKCRVDFRKAPTRIANIQLDVIGKRRFEEKSFPKMISTGGTLSGTLNPHFPLIFLPLNGVVLFCK